MEKEQFPPQSGGVIIRRNKSQYWGCRDSTKPGYGGKYGKECIWVFDRPFGGKNLYIVWFQKLTLHQKRRQIKWNLFNKYLYSLKRAKLVYSWVLITVWLSRDGIDVFFLSVEYGAPSKFGLAISLLYHVQERKEELLYNCPQGKFLCKLYSRGNTACITKIKHRSL